MHLKKFYYYNFTVWDNSHVENKNVSTIGNFL